jgi:hypothetical protein
MDDLAGCTALRMFVHVCKSVSLSGIGKVVLIPRCGPYTESRSTYLGESHHMARRVLVRLLY